MIGLKCFFRKYATRKEHLQEPEPSNGEYAVIVIITIADERIASPVAFNLKVVVEATIVLSTIVDVRKMSYFRTILMLPG